MPAPTARNGLERAVGLLSVPSLVIIFVVVFTRHYYSEFTAGLVLVCLTGLVLLGAALSAKYWNAAYTAGFLFGALFLFFAVPGTYLFSGAAKVKS